MTLSDRPVAGWEAALAPLWALELTCSNDGSSLTLTAERDLDLCRCRSSCHFDVVPTLDAAVVLSVGRVRRRLSPSTWMGTRPVLVLEWVDLRGCRTSSSPPPESLERTMATTPAALDMSTA